MPKNTLFYILLSIVVAILLGDLWVIYPQLSAFHKNIIEDKLKKSDLSIEKKDSTIKNDVLPLKASALHGNDVSPSETVISNGDTLLPLSNSSGEVAKNGDGSEETKKENDR